MHLRLCKPVLRSFIGLHRLSSYRVPTFITALCIYWFTNIAKLPWRVSTLITALCIYWFTNIVKLPWRVSTLIIALCIGLQTLSSYRAECLRSFPHYVLVYKHFQVTVPSMYVYYRTMYWFTNIVKLPSVYVHCRTCIGLQTLSSYRAECVRS